MNQLNRLYQTVLSGNVKRVKSLIEAGTDVNAQDKKGDTLLHHALGMGSTTMIDFLIKAGANVNAINKCGMTPLYLASLGRDTDIVKLLIKAKADINAKDVCGYTALHWAVKRGRTDMVDLLIKAGADVKGKDKEGLAPLYLAAWRGHTDIVNLLTKAEADVNVQNENEDTPLELAVEPIPTYMLRKAMANVNVYNYSTRTPLHDVAGYPNQKEIMDMFIKKGAKLNLKDQTGTKFYERIWDRNIRAEYKKLSSIKDDWEAANDSNDYFALSPETQTLWVERQIDKLKFNNISASVFKQLLSIIKYGKQGEENKLQNNRNELPNEGLCRLNDAIENKTGIDCVKYVARESDIMPLRAWALLAVSSHLKTKGVTECKKELGEALPAKLILSVKSCMVQSEDIVLHIGDMPVNPQELS